MNKLLHDQPDDPLVYLIRLLYRKAALPVPKVFEKKIVTIVWLKECFFLNYLCLVSHSRDFGKYWRLRSDTVKKCHFYHTKVQLAEHAC